MKVQKDREQTGPSADRRTFLRSSLVLPFALSRFAAGTGLAGAADEKVTLLVRQKEPDNLEFPFHTLDSFLTPNDRFYVRNHFPIPQLRKENWRLQVLGAVKRPLELTYAQFLNLPSSSRPVTLECAGNGRSFLVPKVKGVPWELGAIGTANWTGVTLASILEQAGLRDGAVEVVLEGADQGEPVTEPKPPGAIPFARSLPLSKALSKDVILAHHMNDEVLPPAHGFPVRAIVAGWYGMASIKWLTRIVVTERPYIGHGQSIDYAVWQRKDGLVSLTPITEIGVKASIARPADKEVVPANADYRVHGAAWAGGSEVAKVEVSTNGGQTWQQARLLGEPVPFCWRLWEYHWRTPAAGKHTLLARASDKRGRVQPLKRDPDRRNYMISHAHPHEVEVRS